jgi:hypothetical protein
VPEAAVDVLKEGRRTKSYVNLKRGKVEADNNRTTE